MNTQVEKIMYDGQKHFSFGNFNSLESAHAEHRQYDTQLTFEEIDELSRDIPYLHLMEFRNDEHYNDLYFIWAKVYQVVRESEISNRIVKELNAAVCTATFPNSGTQLADLYSCPNSSDVLVFHQSCSPVNSKFVKTVWINLIK